MIKIGGHTWRTLAEPMYVNGRHVQEVWANGVQVYPEVKTGDIIKFRGSINRRFVHFDDFSRSVSYVDEYFGPCLSVYNVNASFSAVMKCNVPIGGYEKNGYGITDADLIYSSGATADYPTHPMYHGTNAMFNSAPLPYSFIQPLHNMAGIKSTGFYLRGNPILKDIRFKYSISDIPICAPLKTKEAENILIVYDHGTGERVLLSINAETDYGGEGGFIITPLSNTIVAAGQYNNMLLGSDIQRLDNQLYFNVGEHVRGIFLVSNSGNDAIKVDGLQLMAVDYTFPINVKIHLTRETDYYGRDYIVDRIIDKGIYDYTNPFYFAVIPTIDIMYIGSEQNAPQWALFASEDDLIL